MLLTSSGIAPGTEETKRKLQQRPSEQAKPIPASALQHVPATAFKLQRRTLLEALRAGGRGSAQDLAGM
eukprot:9916518-Karenia_brevis.AAC.1